MKNIRNLVELPGFVLADAFENEGFVFFDTGSAGGALFGVVDLVGVCQERAFEEGKATVVFETEERCCVFTIVAIARCAPLHGFFLKYRQRNAAQGFNFGGVNPDGTGVGSEFGAAAAAVC